MMDVNVDSFQWSIGFLIEKLVIVVLKWKYVQQRICWIITQTSYKKRWQKKVHSPFIDYIWGANLGDMQLESKFNKWLGLLLCVIDIFSQYAWVILLKDKEGILIANAFQKFLKESNRKPNKIWVNEGSEFYNRSMKSMKSFFLKSKVEMYSMHNEEKSVVAERFIWT